MEEKHDIISSKFSTKPTSPIKRQWQPHVAAQIEEDGVKLVIFKGASVNLAVELAKAMIRYAR